MCNGFNPILGLGLAILLTGWMVSVSGILPEGWPSITSWIKLSNDGDSSVCPLDASNGVIFIETAYLNGDASLAQTGWTQPAYQTNFVCYYYHLKILQIFTKSSL